MNVDNAYDDYLSAHSDNAVKAIKEHEERVHGSNVKFGRFTIPWFSIQAHFDKLIFSAVFRRSPNGGG